MDAMESKDDVVTEVSDRDLVRLSGQGDDDAFKMLFHRHAPTVYAHIASTLESEEDIDDVLQEVFTLAWSKLDHRRMRGDSALPWLIITARNTMSNLTRAERRRPTAPLQDADSVGEDVVVQSVLRNELDATLDAALDRLSDADRELIELCLEKNLTYNETAAATHTSPATVRNRLSRARSFLRGVIAPVRGEQRGR